MTLTEGKSCSAFCFRRFFHWVLLSVFSRLGTLIAFCQKVKPAGPGWTDIRAAAGISDAEIAQENRIGSAFVGWISGCALIWGSLFAIGNFLYAAGDPKRLTMAWVLTAVTLVSGYVLLKTTQQLWADSTASEKRA